MENKSNLFIIIVMFTVFFIFCIVDRFDKTIAVENTFDNAERRNMLLDTAESYMRKGSKYQFDLYRENKFLAPESINSYNNAYTVGSSFVYQVYYNTLGLNTLYTTNQFISAAQNSENARNNYVSYHKKSEWTKGWFNTKVNYQTAVDLIYDFVEPGDIVVFGFNNGIDGGHTAMVYSKELSGKTKVIKLIHNKGSIYNYSSYAESYESGGNNGGSIYIESMLDFLKNPNIGTTKITFENISGVKVLFERDKYLTYSTGNVAANSSTFESDGITDAERIRYKYSKMDVEKTYIITKEDCSSSSSVYVSKDDIIEFTIKITNNSGNSYSGMSISEKIPDNTEFVSSNEGKVSGKNVVFSNVNVSSKGNKTLTFKVKVTNTSGKIISKGNIDSKLPTKEIDLYIGNSLSKTQQQKIIDGYAKTGITKGADSLSYISDLYSSLFKYKFDISGNIISYDRSISEPVRYTKNSYDAVLANYYGLNIGCNTAKECTDNKDKGIISIYNSWRYWGNTDYEINNDENSLGEYVNRPRTLVSEMFETGDILKISDIKNANNYTYYLFVDGKLISNGTIAYDNNSKNGALSPINEFLASLVGRYYVVIRPALRSDFPRDTRVIEYTATEAGVTNLPAKQTYIYSTDSNCQTKITSDKPSRTGYSLEGWIYNTNVYKPGSSWSRNNNNSILVAKWKANSYKIKYNANGGKGAPKEQSFDYSENGTTNLSSDIPTREGYTFNGWSRDKNATSGLAPGSSWKTNVASNVEFFAIWTKNSGSGSTGGNGGSGDSGSSGGNGGNNGNNGNNGSSSTSSSSTTTNPSSSTSSSSSSTPSSSSSTPSSSSSATIPVVTPTNPSSSGNNNSSNNNKKNKETKKEEIIIDDDDDEEIDENEITNDTIDDIETNDIIDSGSLFGGLVSTFVKKVYIDKNSGSIIDQSTDNIEIIYKKVNNDKYKVSIVSRNSKLFKKLNGYDISRDRKILSKTYENYPIKDKVTVKYRGSNDSVELKIELNDDIIKNAEKNTKSAFDLLGMFKYVFLVIILFCIGLIIMILKNDREAKKEAEANPA